MNIAEQPCLFGGATWLPVRDGNHTALSVFSRHYSARPAHLRKVAQFVGPGEKYVLLTPCARGLFVWRKFIDDSGQIGVNCAVFRNEGAGLSSDLIRAADRLAFDRWPCERHYTYVDSRKVRSTNPGYCFVMAGWQHCGMTKSGLRILELLP